VLIFLVLGVLLAGTAIGCSDNSPVLEKRLEVTVFIDFDTGFAPHVVNFDSTVTGGKRPYNYDWDLNGDGTPDWSSDSAEYTYTEPGDYNGTLTVVDQNDTEAVVNFLIQVLEDQ
jgi:PKD repeat protein